MGLTQAHSYDQGCVMVLVNKGRCTWRHNVQSQRMRVEFQSRGALSGESGWLGYFGERWQEFFHTSCEEYFVLWAGLPPLTFSQAWMLLLPNPLPDIGNDIQLIQHNLLHYKPVDWWQYFLGVQSSFPGLSQKDKVLSLGGGRGQSPALFTQLGTMELVGAWERLDCAHSSKTRPSWCPYSCP